MARETCRVSLDEGVDWSDDAGLVAAVVVGVGAGSGEVDGWDGVVDHGGAAPAAAYRLVVALAADSVVSWKKGKS